MFRFIHVDTSHSCRSSPQAKDDQASTFSNSANAATGLNIVAIAQVRSC
jgi:hypothetical protein